MIGRKLGEVIVICSMLLAIFSATSLSQTEEEAHRLVNDGLELEETASTDAEFELVVSKLKKALTVFERTENKNGESHCHFQLGRIAEKRSDPIEALRHLEKSLSISIETRNAQAQGKLLFSIGRLYLTIGESRKAVDPLEKALAFQKARGDVEGEIDICLRLGQAYMHLGRNDESAEALERALVMSRQVSRSDMEHSAQLGLGRLFQRRGDSAGALDHCEKALALAKEHGQPRSAVQVLIAMGEIHLDAGRVEEAFKCLNEATTTNEPLNDMKAESRILCALGRCYSYKRDYSKAFELLEKSLNLARRNRDRSTEMTLLDTLGQTSDSAGNYPKALEWYEQRLSIAEQTGDHQGQRKTLERLGSLSVRLGRYRKAAGYYEPALSMSRKAEDRKTEGLILNGLGGVYKYFGEHGKALDHYNASLLIARGNGDYRDQATILINMASVFKLIGEYGKAEQSGREALALAPHFADNYLKAYILVTLGDICATSGKRSDAVESFLAAHSSSLELGDSNTASLMLARVAEQYFKLNQPLLAIEYMSKSLPILEGSDDTPAKVSVLREMGTLLLQNRAYWPAVKIFNRALRMSRKTKTSAEEAIILNELGEAHRCLGQYGQALQYLDSSLQLNSKLETKDGMRSNNNNIGLVYTQIGKRVEGLEFLQRSLDLDKRLGTPDFLGVTHINVGSIYRNMGRYDEALSYFEKALDICEKTGQASSRPKGLIGMLYLERGDLDKAELLISESGYGPASALLDLRKQEFKRAAEYYRQVADAAELNRGANELFAGYCGLAAAYEGMNDFENARKYYRKAFELTEELRSAVSASMRDGFLNVYIDGFYRTEPYEGLGRVLQKTGNPAEALEISEYAKSRRFGELIAQRRNSDLPAVPKEVIQADKDLNDRLSAARKRLQRSYEEGNQEAVPELVRQVDELNGELRMHIRKLRNESPFFAALKYPMPVSLSQCALRDDEWLLAYDVTDSGILVFLVRGKRLISSHFKAIPRRELDSLVRSFMEPMRFREKRNVEQMLKSFNFVAGYKLSDLLVRDVCAQIPKGSPIIIVPDDSLCALSFEALVMGHGGKVTAGRFLPEVTGTRFFGDRNTLTYYQSITALNANRMLPTRRTDERRLLVIADPVFSDFDDRVGGSAGDRTTDKSEGVDGKRPGYRFLKELYRNLMGADRAENDSSGQVRPLARLHDTGNLAKALERLYPGGCDTYTGHSANKADFLLKLGPQLEKFDTMVFATHGYSGKDLPGIDEPVLILSLVPPGTDGYLRASEIMGLKINADLVVLASSDGFVGRWTRGEGVFSMATAFQYAGARSVLASLWTPSARATTKLVEDFFEHLKNGKSKREALRLAKNELRVSGFNHPFFWACFALAGKPD